MFVTKNYPAFHTMYNNPVNKVLNTHVTKLYHYNSIAGIQSLGWSELIKDKDRLEYMFFPRILALAERAWNKAEWENSTTLDPIGDWERFANKVGYNEYPRLDRNGVKYRVPPSGVAYVVFKYSLIYYSFVYLFIHLFIFLVPFISMDECNTILSAYTLYRHLR